tara:strand:- start:4075 stop:4413 length:339 start_codon:yes stop_codon:yes gene_type:complete
MTRRVARVAPKRTHKSHKLRGRGGESDDAEAKARAQLAKLMSEIDKMFEHEKTAGPHGTNSRKAFMYRKEYDAAHETEKQMTSGPLLDDGPQQARFAKIYHNHKNMKAMNQW